ncbi:MAG: anti-sigma factor domain-containing protein [Egibacteraceae bacterium]
MTRNHRMDPEAHTLVGAYALDAMDAAQRRMFEAHLDECAQCRIEVAELQATAALLGQAAEAVPPPGMRHRVLEAIDAIRQDAPVVPLDSSRSQRWRRQRSGTAAARRRPALAAVAAVLAFAVLALGTLYAQTAARLKRVDEQIATVDAGGDLVAALSAPDARISDVTVPTGGSAWFVWSDRRNVGVLVGDRLPAAPLGRAYALWLINGGHAEYAGSFDPAGGGRVAQVVKGDVTNADQLGVTAEPAGVPVRPTGGPVMSASLT